MTAHNCHQVTRTHDFPVIHSGNDITSTDAGLGSRTSFHHIFHIDPTVNVQFLFFGECSVDGCKGHADKGALYLTVFQQVINHLLHNINRHGKSIPFVRRSEEHTSELQSLMRTSHDVF